jgi:capsule biosynthesis phosphatase
MRIVVMCGGSGTRLHDYSFPKPLNYIHAKPAITYVLQNMVFEEIDFVVAPHLVPFQFESTIRLHFKHKTCRFHYLPYFTRGPVESAWLGTLQFNSERDNEPIVFLDNDVIYSFPHGFPVRPDTAFLGYSVDKSGSEAFSFLRVERNRVMEIQEKKRISDLFGCGVYGFASLNQFREYAKPLLQTPQSKELYMSMVFSEMISRGVEVLAMKCEDPVYHIGSLQEVKQSLSVLPVPRLRICVDLDNTLVTSPIIDWDYSSVQPIHKMITLVQEWKAKGHTIIIHTARRMQTHKNNVGAATADCAKVTLETLEKFGIPYDELLFGKPIADVYIDDKALNPYLNTPESFGFFEVPTKETPVNAMASNKFNQIIVEKGSVVKRGPTKYLAGEIYYHLHIPDDSQIRTFFPKILGYTLGSQTSELRTEYVKGIPLSHLWQAKLLTTKHIDDLVESMKILHNTVSRVESRSEKPSKKIIQENYWRKSVERFEQKDVYRFSNHSEVIGECMNRLNTYCTSNEIKSVDFIHGDFWFSNILLTFQNTFQFIDMKGICWKTQTTGGDPMYDYAKLYQSFLGYDSILYHGWQQESEYGYAMRIYYERKLLELNINLESVRAVTFALILGTLPFIEDKEVQETVWIWAKSIFMPRIPDD